MPARAPASIDIARQQNVVVTEGDSGTTAAVFTAQLSAPSGLTTTVDDAEKNGAMKCAPRELAVARSNLEFAASSRGLRCSPLPSSPRSD